MISTAYFLQRGGVVEGPFTLAQLSVLFSGGSLAGETLISTDQAAWQRLDSVLQFRAANQGNFVPLLLLVVGALGLLYFTLIFDTVVHVSGLPERVNNLGLLQGQLIGVLCSLTSILSGVIFSASNRLSHALKNRG